jgi:lipopolysaccharide exporter
MERSRLREATLGGVRWVSLARVVVEGSHLVSMVVLAHLVPPAAFGQAAIALIVQAVVAGVAGAGFATPLVQRETLRREHVAGAFALVLLVGAALGLATVLLAPLVVEPGFGATTASLVQIASVLFLIGAIGVVPQALLQRQLDFRRVSTAEMLGGTVGAGSSVALALAGLDAEAVVLGIVAGSATYYGALFLFARPPRPAWHGPEIREIVSFGVPASLSSLLRSGFRNVDYAILGLAAGPAVVGFYWRAFQLGVEYQRKISGIMMRIALPVYSRAASLDDMRALRARIVRAHATIIFPMLGCLIATAPALIPWLLGPRWEPAVTPTQLLAVAGMLAAVMTGMGPLILAVGKPKALLTWDALCLVGYAGAILAVASEGLTAVCLAVIGVFFVQLLAAHVFLLRPLVGIPVRQLVDDVLPAGVASAALVAIGLPLLELIRETGAWPPLAVLASASAGLLAYGLALRLVSPASWGDLRLLADRLLGGVPRPRRRRAAATGAATT